MLELLVLTGLALCAYYDVNNKGRIPMPIIDCLFFLSMVYFLFTLASGLELVEVLLFIITFSIIFVLEAKKQIGGADIMLMLSLTLVHPMFALLIIFFAFCLFKLNIKKSRKGKWVPFVPFLLLGYLVFLLAQGVCHLLTAS